MTTGLTILKRLIISVLAIAPISAHAGFINVEPVNLSTETFARDCSRESEFICMDTNEDSDPLAKGLENFDANLGALTGASLQISVDYALSLVASGLDDGEGVYSEIDAWGDSVFTLTLSSGSTSKSFFDTSSAGLRAGCGYGSFSSECPESGSAAQFVSNAAGAGFLFVDLLDLFSAEELLNDQLYLSLHSNTDVVMNECAPADSGASVFCLADFRSNFSATASLTYEYEEPAVSVPEPATVGLMCIGLAGLFMRRRR